MNDTYDIDDALSEQQVAAGIRDTPCIFTCGCAGTGKTYNAVRAVAADATHGVLSSTTGISAVNLGAITVNSLLRYSTTDVMRDHFVNGSLTRVLHRLAKQYRWLYIDEISMYGADALDLLYRAVTEVNRYVDLTSPLGIHILGDFAQLPPVKAPWVFTADCWHHFERNTERLTKVWRQDGGPFLDALNLARRGDGKGAANTLQAAGAIFETMLDTEFVGTTILPHNEDVDNYNAVSLARVRQPAFRLDNRRWGKQCGEWDQRVARGKVVWGIPERVEMKRGAYVMLLANHSDGGEGLDYVNGDCGEVIDHFVDRGPEHRDYLTIKLVRTGLVICVAPVVREVAFPDPPRDWSAGNLRVKPSDDDGRWIPRPHYRGKAKRYVIGQICYWPARLAYASTVHKSQSLTLDRVQIDFRKHFFSQPAMLYSAVSRCRSIQGLRLVGQPEVFAKHCNFDKRIEPWL